jgi:hypothetical protein
VLRSFLSSLLSLPIIITIFIFRRVASGSSFGFVIVLFTNTHPSNSLVFVQQEGGGPGVGIVGTPCLMIIIRDFG